MGYPSEKKQNDGCQSPPAKKMRYADRAYDLSAVSALYVCTSCYVFYEQYTTLVQHLYWRHGTEGKVCPACPVKMWDFAGHKCFITPQADEVAEQVDTDKLLLDDLFLSDSEDEDDSVEKVNIKEVQETERESQYCYCGKDIPGSDMIGCEGKNCCYEWYHYQCVGIEVAPEGDWFCPQCT